jgi:putative heme transporter
MKSRRLLRIGAFTVALLIVVALSLRGRMPSAPRILNAMGGADFGWIAVAAGLQAISMLMFAAQQRLLLQSLGVRVRLGRAMLVTLARSAISISLPAGAAVSAGYALRQYRRAGSTNEVAAATMIVSGLVSIVGLAALYVVGVVGIVAQDPQAVWQSPPPALAVTAIVLLGVLVGIVVGTVVSFRRRRRGSRPAPEVVEHVPTGRWSGYAWAAWAAARNAWWAGSSLRVRDWIAAFAYAAANWLADLLCLAACTRALGLPIGVTTLATIYLGVQIVRQVPITPGGVGVIETAFIAGITAAGATGATATAAVLLYRVLSCWLVIPIGGLAAVALRRSPDLSTEVTGAETTEPAEVAESSAGIEAEAAALTEQSPRIPSAA